VGRAYNCCSEAGEVAYLTKGEHLTTAKERAREGGRECSHGSGRGRRGLQCERFCERILSIYYSQTLQFYTAQMDFITILCICISR